MRGCGLHVVESQRGTQRRTVSVWSALLLAASGPEALDQTEDQHQLRSQFHPAQQTPPETELPGPPMPMHDGETRAVRDSQAQEPMPEPIPWL